MGDHAGHLPPRDKLARPLQLDASPAAAAQRRAARGGGAGAPPGEGVLWACLQGEGPALLLAACPPALKGGRGAWFIAWVTPAGCRHSARPAGGMPVHCYTGAQASSWGRPEHLAPQAPPGPICAGVVPGRLPRLPTPPAYNPSSGVQRPLCARCQEKSAAAGQGLRCLLCQASWPPALLLQGRWKGAIVAIKVIDHRLKGNDMGMDIQRESMLSTSIVHPNVVSRRPADLHPGQPALPCCNCTGQVLLACDNSARHPVRACALAPAAACHWHLCSEMPADSPSWHGAAPQPAAPHCRHLLLLPPGADKLCSQTWNSKSCPVLRQGASRGPLCGCPCTQMFTPLHSSGRHSTSSGCVWVSHTQSNRCSP